MRAHVIFHPTEQRSLQTMSAFEQRHARAITLRQLRLFFFAHLVRILKLLEKFVWVLDAIDAEIEILDVPIAGPQPRRFIRRISLVRRQREVWLSAGDRWRFGHRDRKSTRLNSSH